MEIATIEEFVKIWDFIDSDDFIHLSKTKQIAIIKELKDSVVKFEDAKKRMSEDLLYYLKQDSFYIKQKKVLFILEILSKEEIMKVIIEYLNNEKSCSTKITLTMLDKLNDEQKVKVLSSASDKKLLKLMSDCNRYILWSQKTSKYYKKYYNICKKALKVKEAR